MAELTNDTMVDGRYRILGRIGSGGMADVFSAEDTHLKRQVALKMLHRRFARDEEFVERFRREASSAAGLQHPHVVSVFDRGEHDGTYYIAMEQLQGRPLKELIAEEAPMPQERAIDFAIQVLEASGFAHENGIIHRDLKPHNVIVDADGRAKVTDFGIARAGASEMTETGSIMGTAQYLSPEQAQGHGVTAASDLYSVGVMLYEMLAGRVPFDGDSAVSIALKHLNEEPLPLSALRLDVHPALEGAVMRALAKDPEQRYRDAAEFIAALESARAAIAAAGNGQDTAYFAPLMVEEPVPVMPEEERRRRWPWVLLGLLILAMIAAMAYAFTRPEKVTVPRVEGRELRQAETALRRAGLRPRIVRVRSAAPVNRVIEQEPDPGSEINKGSAVTLEVSSGPGERSVPSVEGLSQRRAVALLNRAGFRVDIETEPSTDLARGIAIRTEPPAGRRVRVGGRVRLIVSSGPRQVEVPNVVGLSRPSAESALSQAGLGVVVAERASDQPQGEVIDQQPRAGSEVTEGSRITITVSSGAAPGPRDRRIAVPRVTGLTENDAAFRLEAEGFRVSVRVRPVGSRSQDGFVVSQSPTPGTELAEGSVVTIVVGRYERATPSQPQGPDRDGDGAPDDIDACPDDPNRSSAPCTVRP